MGRWKLHVFTVPGGSSKCAWSAKAGVVFFFKSSLCSPKCTYHLSASLVQSHRRNSHWVFWAEGGATLPRPCPVCLGSGGHLSRGVVLEVCKLSPRNSP